MEELVDDLVAEQEYLDQQAVWYKRSDGTLDMVLLLASFQEFFIQRLVIFHFYRPIMLTMVM